MTVRVVIADDQREVREGMQMLLRAEADIEVIGLAADGEEACALVAEHTPDVVIMDIRMPGTDGIEATRRIAEARDDDCLTAVLVLTTFDHDDALYGALRAGASGYMLKHAAPSSLARAVRQVADGGSWIDASVAGKVIDTLRSTLDVDESGHIDLSILSKRELEVLTLMIDAPTNTELAGMLYVSESTVKTHISRLLMKTGSHERSQLVAIAWRAGLAR
ncbi:response regulator [Ornithinimicrobium sp. Y1847]|uniref:response regulator transcription factor n=1 Tax=Ornithinimicrobium sp. Y1847 TaxID=3405419 RepID=UPI003B684510